MRIRYACWNFKGMSLLWNKLIEKNLKIGFHSVCWIKKKLKNGRTLLIYPSPLPSQIDQILNCTIRTSGKIRSLTSKRTSICFLLLCNLLVLSETVMYHDFVIRQSNTFLSLSRHVFDANQWRNEIKFWKSLIERTAISLVHRIKLSWKYRTSSL